MKRFSEVLVISFLGLATVPAAATEITASIWFPDTYPLAKDGYAELAKTLKEKSGATSP